MYREEIIAAIIAGSVSLIVSFVTYLGVKRKLKELQFQEIIKKRIRAYSELWGIIIKYANIHYYHKLEYRKDWVISYHEALDKCNMEYGVLFSKDIHDHFEQLREGLQKIRHELDKRMEYVNTQKFQSDCKDLYIIIDNKHDKRKGLGGLLKRGLGSFQKSILDSNK